MKKIYYLHGYQTSGKKFKCIEEFYKNTKEYSFVYWEWNENMDLPKFIKEKKEELDADEGEYIVMADSMGANLAWNLVNQFPNLQYIMTNPVFSPDQIREQERIQPEVRSKIFSATANNIQNKNVRLVISEYDKTLNPDYYKKIFGDSVIVHKIPDEHSIIHMEKYMPLIHQLITDAFEKAKAPL